MHPLVRAVLLGTRGRDSLVNDTVLHPPHVELAQAMDAGRSERDSIVGANRFGQTDLTEQGTKYGLGILGLHRWKAAAGKQRPTEMIGDGERVAVSPVAGFELPLNRLRKNSVI
jgi:hypothetical protein